MIDRNYDSTSSSNGMGMNVMGFVLGVVVGAGVALLFAPATGEDTRRRIGEQATKLRDTAGRKLSSARDVASQKFNDAKHAMNDLKGDAQNAVDAGREAFARSRSGSQAGEPYPTGTTRQS